MKIKQLREMRRLTQEQVANAIGIKRVTYSHYETGKRNPNIDVLKNLSVFYGVPLQYLLGEKAQVQPNQIPVLSSVPADIPFEAIKDIEEYIDIHHCFFKHEGLFALRVQGDSMEPDILQGDIAIVEKQEFADSGDIAVIRVNNNDVTLKRIKITQDGIMLIPYNKAYYPTFFSQEQINQLPVTIIGKVIEIRRRF